jgi:hypothetical protein
MGDTLQLTTAELCAHPAISRCTLFANRCSELLKDARIWGLRTPPVTSPICPGTSSGVSWPLGESANELHEQHERQLAPDPGSAVPSPTAVPSSTTPPIVSGGTPGQWVAIGIIGAVGSSSRTLRLSPLCSANLRRSSSVAPRSADSRSGGKASTVINGSAQPTVRANGFSQTSEWGCVDSELRGRG